jgi:dihydroflavonol-4-reductase
MESDYNEERYIINSENWVFRKLQDAIANEFRKRRPRFGTTKFLMHIAWRLEKIKSLFTKKRPLLTRESARVAYSKTYFENDKILKALPGFSFTPLQESIQKSCEKYLALAGKL